MRYFREHGHATTPIVMSEGTPYGYRWFNEAGDMSRGNPPKNKALGAACAAWRTRLLSSPALQHALLCGPSPFAWRSAQPLCTQRDGVGCCVVVFVPGSERAGGRAGEGLRGAW